MKTVRIPSSMHEVFGAETTVVELALVLGVSAAASLALFGLTHAEWAALALWKVALVFLLGFDILAGFVANLTLGTNAFYRGRPGARWAFIALHIQPIVLALLMGGQAGLCLLVWGYTTIAAAIVNLLQGYPAQRVVAGALAMPGLVGLLSQAPRLPVLLLCLLAFYQLKVILSFAVDHYAPRER